MGKVIYAVMAAFVIELALFLFAGTTYAKTSMFSLLQDPSGFVSSSFYLLFSVALVAWAVSTIIPGNLWQINIYALFAGVAIVFLGFVANIVHLWVFINGELSGVVTNSWVFASIVTFPLMLYYMIAVTEWVRSNV